MSEAEQKYPNCFGCGADNPIGLRLRYRYEGDALVTEFTPADEHEGWPSVVHGGIIATLLYEVMENFAFHKGVITMMRDMDIQLRRPAKIGERITATARLDRRERRQLAVSATLTQDRLIAKGKASLVELTAERRKIIGI